MGATCTRIWGEKERSLNYGIWIMPCIYIIGHVDRLFKLTFQTKKGSDTLFIQASSLIYVQA